MFSQAGFMPPPDLTPSPAKTPSPSVLPLLSPHLHPSSPSPLFPLPLPSYFTHTPHLNKEERTSTACSLPTAGRADSPGPWKAGGVFGLHIQPGSFFQRMTSVSFLLSHPTPPPVDAPSMPSTSCRAVAAEGGQAQVWLSSDTTHPKDHKPTRRRKGSGEGVEFSRFSPSLQRASREVVI